MSTPTRGEPRPLQSQSQSQSQQSQTSSDPSTGTPELAAAVDELLDQLQHKFDEVSTEIFGKLDDMTRRLDELEASLTTAQEESGLPKA